MWSVSPVPPSSWPRGCWRCCWYRFSATVVALLSSPGYSKAPRMGRVCPGRSPLATRCRSLQDSLVLRWRRPPPNPGRSFHHRFAVGAKVYVLINNHRWHGEGNHPGYLHGLCPCRAPSSSSSGAGGRGAGRLEGFVACCTFRARRAISSFSATERVKRN